VKRKRMEDQRAYCIWQGEAKSACRLCQKLYKIEFSMYNISHMTQKGLKKSTQYSDEW
jgi:hypothetical protein